MCRFEDKFRYDDQGLPRVWQQGENIEKFYLAARDSAEETIFLFSKLPIPESAKNDNIAADEVQLTLFYEMA
jgi:hypothetical protein